MTLHRALLILIFSACVYSQYCPAGKYTTREQAPLTLLPLQATKATSLYDPNTNSLYVLQTYVNVTLNNGAVLDSGSVALSNMALVKYIGNKMIQWVTTFVGDASSSGDRMSMCFSGGAAIVVVFETSSANITSSNGAMFTSAAGSLVFVTVSTASGTVTTLAKMGSATPSQISGIATDDQNNVYMSIRYGPQITLGAFTLANVCAENIAIVKMSSNFVVQWVAHGTNNDCQYLGVSPPIISGNSVKLFASSSKSNIEMNGISFMIAAIPEYSSSLVWITFNSTGHYLSGVRLAPGYQAQFSELNVVIEGSNMFVATPTKLLQIL